MIKLIGVILTVVSTLAVPELTGPFPTGAQFNKTNMNLGPNGLNIVGNSGYFSNFNAIVLGRELTNRFADVINIKDSPFSATGNGVTDDTASITAALATGKSLFIPDGVYKITSTLQPTTGQMIYGTGPRTSIFLAGANGVTIFGNSGTDPIDTIIFHSIGFACATNIIATSAIELKDITNVRIHDVDVLCVTNDFGFNVYSNQGFIYPLKIYGRTPNGSYCNSIYDCKLVTVNTNIAVAIHTDADTIGFGANSSHIRNCRIRADGGMAILISKGDDIHFVGNTVEGNTRLGIKVVDANLNRIQHNRMEVGSTTNTVAVLLENTANNNEVGPNYYYGWANYLVESSGTGNIYNEPQFPRSSRNFQGTMMFNATDSSGPQSAPRAAVDILINPTNTAANEIRNEFLLSRPESGLAGIRINETRRLNYIDHMIGRNLRGTNGADTYYTIKTTGNGYQTIEFRYPGNILFMITNGNTTAGASVTPNIMLNLDSVGNSIRFGGSQDASGVVTRRGTTLQWGDISALKSLASHLGTSKNQNYLNSFWSRGVKGTEGSDDYTMWGTGGYQAIELADTNINFYVLQPTTSDGALSNSLNLVMQIRTNSVWITGTNVMAAIDSKVAPTRAINTTASLTGGGDLSADRTLQLVNDSASPGNSKLYGTDSTGTKGWYDRFARTNTTTICLSDTTSQLVAGTAKQFWRVPYNMTFKDVKLALWTPSSSGAVTVDVNKNGTTIFSTNPSIASGSTNATTAAVLSTTTAAVGDTLTFDIDASGTSAVNLQVTIYHTDL